MPRLYSRKEDTTLFVYIYIYIYIYIFSLLSRKVRNVAGVCERENGRERQRNEGFRLLYLTPYFLNPGCNSIFTQLSFLCFSSQEDHRPPTTCSRLLAGCSLNLSGGDWNCVLGLWIYFLIYNIHNAFAFPFRFSIHDFRSAVSLFTHVHILFWNPQLPVNVQYATVSKSLTLWKKSPWNISEMKPTLSTISATTSAYKIHERRVLLKLNRWSEMGLWTKLFSINYCYYP